jgi:hypothetical protein
MESLFLGVVLNSSILIEAERQHLLVAQFLDSLAPVIREREAALRLIGIAELAHSVHRATTTEPGYGIATRNQRQFGKIPGLALIRL